MINMFGNEPKVLDDLLRLDSAGMAVCRACGHKVKHLYMTDKGYFCREHK